jgi:hypothetical protein
LSAKGFRNQTGFDKTHYNDAIASEMKMLRGLETFLKNLVKSHIFRKKMNLNLA